MLKMFISYTPRYFLYSKPVASQLLAYSSVDYKADLD